MAEIICKIYDNIDSIAEKDWDAVFGGIPESYRFYKAVAASKLPGFVFYYLVAYRGDEILLIAPLFSADFHLDIAVEGRLSGAIKSLRRIFPRFLVTRTLFCGSPFAENGNLGVGREFRDEMTGLIELLARRMDELAVKIGASLVIFKDFLEEAAQYLDVLPRQGFSKAKSFPAVAVDINFRSFEDYLKSLGKSSRKNLNKKLKEAYARGNIEIREAVDVSGELAQIIRLYENTYQQGATKFEHLNEDFFLKVTEEMPSQARFLLYYCESKLAAFNLCFVYKDLLIDKFIGFDYDICVRFNLYFVSWAHNIKRCIENGLRYYYPGQTDYGLKLRLGGKLIPLFAYLRHRNYFFNFLLKLLIALLKPDNFDKEIRGRRHV